MRSRGYNDGKIFPAMRALRPATDVIIRKVGVGVFIRDHVDLHEFARRSVSVFSS